jgi:hypothetical protein
LKPAFVIAPIICNIRRVERNDLEMLTSQSGMSEAGLQLDGQFVDRNGVGEMRLLCIRGQEIRLKNTMEAQHLLAESDNSNNFLEPQDISRNVPFPRDCWN